ncbi:glycosyl transferase [Longibacter salinarum]|uniref:Glycosyl transferase n=1 Tax=Longibacter salinarum TaxID=1850348 RepID=A0A2A8CWL6_9BACT|nr:glycosyl transferase [Longibacter salinarum]
MKGEGQGRVNLELARLSAQHGHTITCLASDVDNRLLMEPNVEWVPMPDANAPNALLGNLRFAQESTSWIQEHGQDVDLIVANGANTWAPVDVNIIHFVHSAWRTSNVHDSKIRRDVKGMYQWVYSKVNANIEQRVLPRARRLVAVSEKVKRELIHVGCPPENISVIHNGVDATEFHPGPASRQQLGLPDGVPIGLFAGDIRTPRKGLDTVIKALPDAKGIHIAVAGRIEGSPFPQMCSEIGVADRVHFLGFRSDIPDLMRASDFFVFPSRYEACSLVLLEALGSGLPILTAQSAGGAELVQSSAGVVIDDPDDVTRVAVELRRLAAETRTSDSMSRAARRIAENHSWNGMARKYLSLFDTLSISSCEPSFV